jgi:MraZ protein
VASNGVKWDKVEATPRPPMLLGEYEHTVDDKNRLTLPAKFREAFAGGVVLTRGMDGCLYAYTRDQWDALAAEIGRLSPLSPEGRTMKRFFFSAAAVDEPDRQGRITIPPALAQHAGLGREVVVAGVYDHLEVWDRAAWRDQLQKVEGSAEDVARRLAEAG